MAPERILPGMALGTTLLSKWLDLDPEDENADQTFFSASAGSLQSALDVTVLPSKLDKTGLTSTLRSVGSIFTMSAGGLSMDASFEFSEMAREMASRVVEQAEKPHVWFKTSANSMLDVTTPYAEVYGIHPRYFNVGQGNSMTLTPVAGMLRSKGLTCALRGRARSSSERRRTEKKDSPSKSRTKRPEELIDFTGEDLQQLLHDPKRSLEVFSNSSAMAGTYLQDLEKARTLMQDSSHKVYALEEEAQHLRDLGRSMKLKLAQMDEHGAGDHLTEDAAHHTAELTALRSQFQGTVQELWKAEAELDRLESRLQTEAAQLQKDFKSWHSSLRKRLHRECQRDRKSVV